MQRDAALQIGERERLDAVSPVRDAKQREQCCILADLHQLPIAQCPAMRRECKAECSDFSEERVRHRYDLL
jgi:hypothetical protein